MNASFLVSPSLRGWFAASELAPHIETIVERSVRDGYSCRISTPGFATAFPHHTVIIMQSSMALPLPPFQVAARARTERLP